MKLKLTGIIGRRNENNMHIKKIILPIGIKIFSFKTCDLVGIAMFFICIKQDVSVKRQNTQLNFLIAIMLLIHLLNIFISQILLFSVEEVNQLHFLTRVFFTLSSLICRKVFFVNHNKFLSVSFFRPY